MTTSWHTAFICAFMLLVLKTVPTTGRTFETWNQAQSMLSSECRPFKVVDADAPLAPVAILMSGGSRTFYESWPSIHRFLFEGNHVDVYGAVNLPAKPARNDCWQFIPLLATQTTRYLHVEHISIDGILSDVKASSNPGAPYKHRQNNTVYPPAYYNGALIQHFWNHKAYTAMRHVEQTRNHQYKVVVRLRPDATFLTPKLHVDLVDLHQAGLARSNGSTKFVVVPNSNGFGGITDMFAVMSRDAADTYYNMLSYMEATLTSNDTTVPFHPETMLQRNIEASNVTIVYMEDVLQQETQLQDFVFDYCLRRDDRCDWSPARKQESIYCPLPNEHGG